MRLTSEVTRHLGKKPRVEANAPLLKLREFVDRKALAAIPASFGHQSLVPDWGMQGNDVAGNCVEAEAIHHAMLVNAEGGHKVAFSDDAAIRLYEAITGYDPSKADARGNNPTDQGTDMDLAAKYLRKRGVKDTKGKIHKPAAYLDLTPGDLAEYLYSVYYFGAVSLGFVFPAYAMDQFNAGKVWTLQKANAREEGGHCVADVARIAGLQSTVTWGRLQGMDDGFFKKQNDQGIAFLSTEILDGSGRTPEGLNLAALQDAFKQVTNQR